MKKKNHQYFYFFTLTSLSFYFLMTRTAHAYLDPGTGSYIIQIVLAALLGALFSLRIFWSRMGRFFNRLFSRDNRDKN